MNETWTLVVDSFWPLLWAGLRGTIPLALASFAIGLVLALGVALMRISANRDRCRASHASTSPSSAVRRFWSSCS